MVTSRMRETRAGTVQHRDPRAPVTESQPAVLAAVDLGSNSFHMIIARVQGDEPVTVDRIREQVQLASGLDTKLSGVTN